MTGIKISEVLAYLIEESDFTDTRTLAEEVGGVDFTSINRWRNGEASMRRIDKVFQRLTQRYTLDDLKRAFELMQLEKLEEHSKDNFL